MTTTELISKLQGVAILHPDAEVVIDDAGPMARPIQLVSTGELVEDSHLFAQCDGAECFPTRKAVVLIPIEIRRHGEDVP